jgi:transposase
MTLALPDLRPQKAIFPTPSLLDFSLQIRAKGSGMRGDEEQQESLIVFSSLEDRVPADHPLRTIRRLVDTALREMSPLFDELCGVKGRHSIPPEYLLRACLLQKLYGIPSERKLCEHLEYNLLFRWFVGLPFSEPAWDHSTFSKNRERILTFEIFAAFFEAVRRQAESRRLLSKEHFSVDGTLIEAAASIKSFRPKSEAGTQKRRGHDSGGNPLAGAGRNPDQNFRGERRSNETHESTTDPDARLARIKGKEAKLSYRGHLLIENRNGLIADCTLTQATGKAETEAALALLTRERSRQGKRPMTVGADRGYHTRDFVKEARALKVTPHVAKKSRYNAIDGRTTSHDGYRVSQRRRKLVEEPFGWMKDRGGIRKLLHRGLDKVAAVFTLSCACYNLVRLRTLMAEPALGWGEAGR